jgi:hypothetical protein
MDFNFIKDRTFAINFFRYYYKNNNDSFAKFNCNITLSVQTLQIKKRDNKIFFIEINNISKRIENVKSQNSSLYEQA